MTERGRVLVGDAELCFLFAVDLLGLLKWRSNTNLLQQNLRQLMKVDGGEVVKVTQPHAEGFSCFLYIHRCSHQLQS
jgi:hypothetical protein